MEFFKDLSEAWSQRLRSPFIGSIALSFFAVNWQPVWYLLFADRPVRQKFLYFDANTSLVSLAVIPIVVGVALALATPWLRTLGTWWAQGPNGKMKEIQHNAAHKLKILEISTELVRVEAEANLQATQERAKIDAAKRLEEAATVGGQELKAELEEERRVNEPELPTTTSIGSVSKSALEFLKYVSRDKSGAFRLSDYEGKYKVIMSGKSFQIPNRKKFLEYSAAIAELRDMGLLEKKKDAISSKGYELLTAIDIGEEPDISDSE